MVAEHEQQVSAIASAEPSIWPSSAASPARRQLCQETLAEVAQAEGLSPSVLSIETVRQALLRLEVGWKRAKRWLTSPDPAYAQKNAAATG